MTAAQFPALIGRHDNKRWTGIPQLVGQKPAGWLFAAD